MKIPVFFALLAVGCHETAVQVPGDEPVTVPSKAAVKSAPSTPKAKAKVVNATDFPAFEFALGKYDTPQEACVGEAVRLSPPRRAGEITQACLYRLHHSSRGKKIVSFVDGSMIHDRDRPWAMALYSRLLMNGRLDPENCEYHRLREKKHSKGCHALAYNWDAHFKRPSLSTVQRNKWLWSPHAAEEFGARGYFDVNANFITVVRKAGYDTCFPMRFIEDPGVGAMLVVLHANQICDELGSPCYDSVIRKHWSTVW